MYILPDARDSYRHWWNAQVQSYALWFAYRHLNIPCLDYTPRVPYRHRPLTRGWMRKWDISTSGESRFVQAGYAKKEISDVEQSRRDWRERKGFKRDRAKRRHWCSCGRYVKQVDHRSRRAYEREMIDAQRWDEMYDHQDMFVSSWDCC
jgi:hypothetical protein